MQQGKIKHPYRRPTYIDGFSRIFDFANSLSFRPYSQGPLYSDFDAFRYDWQMIGDDFYQALDEFEEYCCPRSSN